MNRRAAALYLCLTLIGITVSHVGFVEEDNGTLMDVDGKLIDVIGIMSDFKTRILRSCASVKPLLPQSPDYASAMTAIRNFSQPDSASARIASLLQHDGWLLAEVEFDALLPAVVLLRKKQNAIMIQDRAIWSGTTHPWEAAPLIRHYIARQATDAPALLFACFTPRSMAFK